MNKPNINDIKNEEVKNALWSLINQDITYQDLQECFDILLNTCIKADRYDKLTKIPTEEKVLKEIEALGYELSRNERRHIIFMKGTIKLELYNYGTVFYTKSIKKNYEPITLQEHQLITKIIKARGWFNE